MSVGVVGESRTLGWRTDVQRIIGTYRGQMPGPTLICLAGIHGNEPSGFLALQRVFRKLVETRPAFRGELIGLSGNLRALREGSRFIEDDLNRMWTPERVTSLRTTPPQTPEETELLALMTELESIFERGLRDVFFMDLHTTSGDGLPFALMGDTLRNRAFAQCFPVPVILGLEERLSGTITEFVNDRGAVAVGFEAGRHDDPESVDQHEAAVWIGLSGAGNIPDPAFPAVEEGRALLRRSTGGLPGILEVKYRHEVSETDEFVMKPGYRTFQPIEAGEVVAADRSGAVAAPMDGMMLLPLYQSQGNDGFFVAKPVRKFWLTMSALLRRLRADHLLRFFPGIRRDPERPGVLLVDTRVARFLATDIFHLFGFRRCMVEPGKLVFQRRTHDFSEH